MNVFCGRSQGILDLDNWKRWVCFLGARRGCIAEELGDGGVGLLRASGEPAAVEVGWGTPNGEHRQQRHTRLIQAVWERQCVAFWRDLLGSARKGRTQGRGEKCLLPGRKGSQHFEGNLCALSD